MIAKLEDQHITSATEVSGFIVYCEDYFVRVGWMPHEILGAIELLKCRLLREVIEAGNRKEDQ